jgi:hypothetical protein
MRKITSRKYDIATIMILVVTLTALSVFALLFSNFNNTFGNDLRDVANDMDINSTYANDATEFMADDLPKYSDNYVFWFFVATFIGLIFTALYLEFEPAVMILLFIFGSIAVLGAWLGSEVYGEFAIDESLNATAVEMSKTQLLMSNPYFPVFIFIGLIVMMIVMYNKKRAGEYQ